VAFGNLSSREFQVTLWGTAIAMTSPLKQSAEFRALFLAGHPALDFLNTRMRVAGEFVDLFERYEDVLSWLEQAGFTVIGTEWNDASRRLLNSARKLRQSIRVLVEKRKAGRRGDPAILNDFLAQAQSYPQLVWNKPRSLKIHRIRRQDTAEAILAPIAEAAADLLTRADFHLVKRCEDESCVLWFSDQTKSHHRRWCSMELCGNRHKVAAYRKRRREDVLSTRGDDEVLSR
jgi:predicted RNA-binding Zn ribbon-like protein